LFRKYEILSPLPFIASSKTLLIKQKSRFGLGLPRCLSAMRGIVTFDACNPPGRHAAQAPWVGAKNAERGLYRFNWDHAKGSDKSMRDKNRVERIGSKSVDYNKSG